MPFNMNQSFFQMLTGATSNLRMSSRFDEDSDEDSDDDTETGGVAVPSTVDKGKSKAPDRKSWAPSFPRLHSIEEAGNADASEDEAASDMESSRQGPAPFMSQLLEAQAQMNTTSLGMSVQETEAAMFSSQDQDRFQKGAPSSELAKKLREIFDFPQTEQVVSGKWSKQTGVV
jgi:sterol 3beta-glucosyltransferase